MNFSQAQIFELFLSVKIILEWGKSFDMKLTHCGLVMPYSGTDLGQHWLR